MVKPYKKVTGAPVRKWRTRPINKKPRKGLPVTTKNSKAIVRLQTQVNNAQMGHYQTNFQLAKTIIPAGYTLNRSHPICFCMNDFTSATQQNTVGGRIYGGHYTGVSPDIINTPVVVGQWQTVNPSFQFGMAKRYRQHADDGINTASLVAYSPISASHNLTFTRNSQEGSVQDTFIRVDIITAKRRFLSSKYHAYSMPDALASFQEMAISNADGMRNKYNPALWNVKSKYLKIKSVPPSDQQLPRKFNGGTIRLYQSFDRKCIRLNLDQAGANEYEDFFLATDPKTQVWCVISTSDDVATVGTTPLSINFQRTIRYRDQHGISM